MRVWRKAAAVGAATAITMGSAAFAAPGIAAADTVSTNCGGSVVAEVGDTIRANTSVLGLNLGSITLGTVQETGTSVLSKTVGLLQQLLCKVTVTVTTAVDDVADGVSAVTPDPLKPVTDPVTGAVKNTTEQARQASGAKPESQAGEPPLSPTDPVTGPSAGGTGSKPSTGGKTGTVEVIPSTPVPGSSPLGGSIPGGTLPSYFGLPMNNFSGTNPLFDTAPGLRYGTGFDGYAPQFGLLGDDGIGGGETGTGIRNAGSASALAPEQEAGIGLPMLIAVLALAGASAGLVRTWVLRSAASTAV